MEPSCHDYQPPKAHDWKRHSDHDDWFGFAWACQFCPVTDYTLDEKRPPDG